MSVSRVALVDPGKEQRCTLSYVAGGFFTLLKLFVEHNLRLCTYSGTVPNPHPFFVSLLCLQAPDSISKEREMIFMAPLTPTLNSTSPHGAPFSPACLNFP